MPTPSNADSAFATKGTKKSTIKAPPTGNDNNKREQFALRMRSDSTGSTRGALFKPQVPPSTKQQVSHEVLEARERQQKKKAKKRQSVTKPPKSTESHDRSESVADIAAQAMIGMEEGQDAVFSDIGYKSAASNVASGLSTGDSRRSRMNRGGMGTLMSDSINAPQGLATIRDDSIEGLTSPNSSKSQIPSMRGPDFNGIHASNLTTGSLLGDRFTSYEGGSSMTLGNDAYFQGSQTNEIAHFSSMLHAGYGAVGDSAPPPAPSNNAQAKPNINRTVSPPDEPSADDDDDEGNDTYSGSSDYSDYSDDETWFERLLHEIHPVVWLTKNAVEDDYGNLHFKDNSIWSLTGLIRHILWNPLQPEFTSLQQFSWAVILGVVMGIYTAFWKEVIEGGLDFVWVTVPEALLRAGLFTEPEGNFPLFHYVWICPAIFGGILSYIFVVIKIPDQNEWINSVHARGVQDHKQLFTLWCLSTLGMLSGLSLGPELPLVLTAGMVGSYLGLACKQSMLQARVLNLTSAGAAVGGFFGFPMAGALFVLEIPHRMGLQYFEALSPATISSIVAVLINRIVTGNEVTGYYSYPFLTATLPSSIFTHAIVYGVYGAAVGIVYAIWVMKLKGNVHDWFHAPHDDNHHPPAAESTDESEGEKHPLMGGGGGKKRRKKNKAPKLTLGQRMRKTFCIVFPEETTRATVAGTIAGALVGVVGIFVPHTMFWGEAQLQNLIDRGRTPLPVFGVGDEPTAVMTSLGYCMVDSHDPAAVHQGFDIGCSALISVAKIFVIGLSLGTGIIGGHFWGPLFVGCSASHFLTDLVNIFADYTGFGRGLAAYPCVVILCTMASAHVVTFRAHMAIMLILTLTISAFNPEDDVTGDVKVAGDYSAVFPLLVVSVFVALMISRQTVFYKTQRSRGDIMAVPEVLCEPGMEGRPMVLGYEGEASSIDDDNSDGDEVGEHVNADESASRGAAVNKLEVDVSPSDIEREFASKASTYSQGSSAQDPPLPKTNSIPPPPPITNPVPGNSDDRLNQLLYTNPSDSVIDGPIDKEAAKQRRFHRRTQSAPLVQKIQARSHSPGPLTLERKPSRERFDDTSRSRSNSISKTDNLMRVNSYGEIQQHQPSLMEQARLRAATSSNDSGHRRVPSESKHRRVPSMPSGHKRVPSGRHSRKSSDGSFFNLFNNAAPGGSIDANNDGGALDVSTIDSSFEKALKQINGNQDGTDSTAFKTSPWSNSS